MSVSDDAGPFERLLEEHREFVDKLTELEAALDEMMATREASASNRVILDEALRFLKEDLEPHFRAEDEVVLPPLEAKIGRFGTLVNVVAYEHEEVRREIGKLAEARAQLDASRDPWPAIQELNRHGIFTIQFLRDHFRKERVTLFPTAMKELSGDQLAAIGKDLAMRRGA